MDIFSSRERVLTPITIQSQPQNWARRVETHQWKLKSDFSVHERSVRRVKKALASLILLAFNE